MKYVACVFALGAIFCGLALGEQMKVGDLYKMCTSSNQIDKTGCRFYVLGVFEGAGLGAASVT